MQFPPHTGLLWQFIWPLKNRGDFWRSFFLEVKQMFLKILLWVWQLPQNLIGFIYSRFAKSQSTFYFNNKKTVVYYCSCFKSGILIQTPFIRENASYSSTRVWTFNPKPISRMFLFTNYWTSKHLQKYLQ